MKTIDHLKKTWEIDEKAFATKELGGLQSFVKDVFECKELFDLLQGNESTKIEKRKNEFTIETNKQNRRADFVIYIKGNEIVIPVEVERYNNIQAGVKQLANYQNDWQKAYGILTDGFHWRFYNNTSYTEFKLDSILNNPSQIKTFWEDYLKEENYYLTFFEKTGQLSLFKEEEALKIDENRELFFEDITKLIKNFKNKLGIVGYLQESGTVDSDKKATEIAYAYIIQFILYKNLVDNCYGDFNEQFVMRIEKIHDNLKTKNYQGIVNQVYGISDYISAKLYKPFHNEQEFITEKIQEVLRKPQVNFEEVTLWLDIIVFIKKYNFINMQNEIFGFIYENYLKELYEDTNKGQYFTDPAVVEFMLDEIGFTEKEIKKLSLNNQLNKISLVDPSCGSGTFLYSAVNRIINALFDGSEIKSKEIEELINNNIFGLDIAEFPLYLAEMNILMRMLPLIVNEQYNNAIDKKIKMFKTQDSISEFMDTGIVGKINKIIDDEGQATLPFDSTVLELNYKSYIRDEDDLKEMKKSMTVPRRRFDNVIGNPPYIDYNECCKQNVLFTKLDSITMSNIYGVNLNTVPGRIKPYSPKPNLFAFFIALGGGLLKENGKLCYIIPQTLLTSNDLDVVRYYFSKEMTIEKIITFDGKMFIGRGLKGNRPVATSSLIFVVKKSLPKPNHSVKIINYENHENESDFGKLLNSRKKNTKVIPQTELVENIANWNFINKFEEYRQQVEIYKQNSISIEDFRKSLNDYDDIVLDGSVNINKKDLSSDAISNSYLVPLIEKNKLKICNYLYCDVNKFKQAQGGRNIGILSSRRFKILWKYQNTDDFYFSDMSNSIPKFMEYCIATNNRDYALFIFAILKSKINTWYLKSLLLIPQEKSFMLGLKTIKEFIRIPKYEDKVYKEIINQTELILQIEENKLTDFIDFTKITVQKFDNYKFENDKLHLYNNSNTFTLKIQNMNVIDIIINEFNKIYPSLSLPNNPIKLNDLKNINIIDKSEQIKIKDYVDDLIFSLYYNIPLENIGINNSNIIKSKCKKVMLYKIISSS